jgi:hypothetical protein
MIGSVRYLPMLVAEEALQLAEGLLLCPGGISRA